MLLEKIVKNSKFEVAEIGTSWLLLKQPEARNLNDFTAGEITDRNSKKRGILKSLSILSQILVVIVALMSTYVPHGTH